MGEPAQVLSVHNQTDRAVRWWLAEDPEEMAREVEATYVAIRTSQAAMSDQNLTHMKLFRNTPMLGLQTVNQALAAMGLERLSLNVVRNMCSTVTSKISKNRPRPRFQTFGAGPKTRKKSELLGKFTDGVFYSEKVFQKTPRVFMDCTIFGTGCVKVSKSKKQITIERVFPPEIAVDELEGMHQAPRNIYQAKYIDRSVAMATWPDAADEISKLGPPEGMEIDTWYAFNDNSRADLVRIIECYHLPSKTGSGDGRYCIQAGGKHLESGPWTEDFLPYVFIRWNPGHVGFWGMGLAEELHGIQSEINRLIRKIQTAMSLLSNPYVMTRRSAAVAKSKMTDVPGTWLEYNDVPPQVVTPQTVNPEVFAHLDRLYQRAYEIAGISQLSAQSQKPVGFDSGRALLVHQDIESDRFAMVTREWENLHMQIAEMIVKLGKGMKVKVFGEEGYEEIDFNKDIDVGNDSWMIQIMPVNFLPDTPGGQLDFIERMQKMGIITDPDEFVDQFNGPDVQSFVRRKTSARRRVETAVQSMIDGGEYVSPDAEMNLVQAAMIAQEMYNEAFENEDVKEGALGNVRQFMLNCKRLMSMPITGPMTTQNQPGVSAAPPPGADAPQSLAGGPGAPSAGPMPGAMPEGAAA